MPKTYARNGVWGWSVEAQDTVLAAAAPSTAAHYRDILKENRAKRPAQIHGEWLTERDAMFRPTGRRNRDDTIYVATMLALGIREADLAKVLAAAADRGLTIVALDSGVSIAPSAGALGVSAALEDWARAKRSAQTQPGRLLGVQAAASAKRSRTMAKLPEARPLWRDARPDRLTSEQVAERVGLSVKTLYSELGRRPAVKKKASRSLSKAVREIHSVEI